MVKLASLAKLIRSKNAGSFLLTFDVLFDSAHEYMRVKNLAQDLHKTIAEHYQVSVDDVRVFTYDPGLAIKITLPREYPCGDPMDNDVYGAQQHLLIMELDV